MKLTSLPQAVAQHCLIYGPPKVGKTQLVTELAKEFNIIHFDLEKGRDPYYKLPPEAQARVEIVDIPDTRSYPIAIETCLKVIKGGLCVICDLHGKVDCPKCKAEALKKDSNVTFTSVELNKLGTDTIVVFDSLTQLTNSAIAHITQAKPDDYKLEYDDWARLGKLMDVFLSHVQQAPYHVICISHETEAELEDGKVKIVPTAGTRNFSRNSAKYFDHVVYAQVSNAKHTFTSMTTQTMNIVVGSRSDIDTKQSNSLIPMFQSRIKPPQSNGQIAAAQLQGMVKK